MRRMGYAVVLLALLIGLWTPSVALAGGGGETIDLLIQTDGSVDALLDFIVSIGGTVSFRYKNVPVVAASVPVDQTRALAGFPGVTLIEKDEMVYLPDDVGDDVHPLEYTVEAMEGVDIQAVDPLSIDVEALPEGYVNFLYTGAIGVWEATDYGAGTVVAVVDTGVTPNVCLSHAVIGAPGFPDGYNATGDGVPATDPSNHWHGTHVGGVIASACALGFEDPTNPLYQAISTYLPWPPDFVPILGQAPGASLYPVKVFPQDGSGVPTSVILDGLDHVLTLKKDGLLDIDIVNMSLGGPTLFDGRDTFDLFIRELKAANILVVTSAGNEGPIPNSVGSPATSYDSVSVGALDYAPSSRVLYEYLGLTRGVDGVPFNGDEGPGMGMVMRPTDETRVANFSSRGPLSDGRAGPDISALGLWNFAAGPENELRWAGGTSFSSPTVAGVAALLNAYWENTEGRETNPLVFRAVLLKGANPNAVAEPWRDINDMGWGAVDAMRALQILKEKSWGYVPFLRYADLNVVLPRAGKGRVDVWESDVITLNPSESFDAVFEVNRYTSKVTIEVFDITTDDNSAYAYWPNALEVHLQSAKRTAFRHPIGVYWYPFWYGDSFDIVVEDGPWTFWGIPWTYQPMEPGLMKLSLIGDFSNEAPVSFRVRITRENFRQPLRHPIATGYIEMGDAFLIPVEIPEGVGTATFDLVWHRDWSKFPTSDIDMFILDPDFNLASVDGVSGNAPERAVIESPAAGTWWVYIEGYEMYARDFYRLYLTLE
ncbi:MAG TPA: S8 family serine peptidase [Thermoflexia bacterium]|jgi:subtilisin family serine protease|nr:S8 family serine peptidase [Thermoflexia bacterium]